MSTLDPELLTEVFAARLGSGVKVTSVQRGPVGNGQEVWFVVAEPGPRDLVLRRTAPGGPLEWTDREREFLTLAAVSGNGLPVPRGLWSEPEGSALGASYFVMERLPGEPVRGGTSGDRISLAADVGRWIARLHGAGIAAEAVGRERPEDAAAATGRELASWSARYREERPAPVPILGVLLAHLERSAPGRGEEAVLLWGDAGLHNVLHRAGEVTGMLDWELSHFGDPHEDLGALAWSLEDGNEFAAALGAYESEAGRRMDPDRIRFFEAMACATRSVMLVNALAHLVSGTTDAPNLAGLGLSLVPASLERAGRLLGWDTAVMPLPAPPPPDPERIRPDVAELLEGTGRFLSDRVLPTVEDAVLRRGLRTIGALLDTAALRTEMEPAWREAVRRERAALLDHLREAGVDTRPGFEDVAVLVETDDGLAGHRARIHEHLMFETAVMRAAARPLDDLYGA